MDHSATSRCSSTSIECSTTSVDQLNSRPLEASPEVVCTTSHRHSVPSPRVVLGRCLEAANEGECHEVTSILLDTWDGLPATAALQHGALRPTEPPPSPHIFAMSRQVRIFPNSRATRAVATAWKSVEIPSLARASDQTVLTPVPQIRALTPGPLDGSITSKATSPPVPPPLSERTLEARSFRVLGKRSPLHRSQSRSSYGASPSVDGASTSSRVRSMHPLAKRLQRDLSRDSASWD